MKAMKAKGERIVFVTAYDYTSALIADAAGVDAILVGDSLGNVIQGHSSTLPVELDHMVYHTAAVARGTTRAVVVADLSFGTFQCGVERTVDAAVKLAKAGAEAVKLEGPYLAEIREIDRAGIPVMGHLGFTPQSVHRFGGFKVQGRTDGDAIISAAKAIEEAGAFAIVLELIPHELAEQITKELTIPTIGIGAGPLCDGQVQVFHDLLGLTEHEFKHAKRYVQGRDLFLTAFSTYAEEVREGSFPTKDNSF